MAHPNSPTTNPDSNDGKQFFNNNECHFDSPGHTSTTTTVSSFDEHDDNPQLLPHRLGRVISSSSSQEDGGITSFLNENTKNRTFQLHRRPLIRKSLSSGSYQYDLWLSSSPEVMTTKDKDLDVASSLTELQQLNRLASMDSNDYHQHLLDNSLPSLLSKKSSSSFCNSYSTSIQTQMMQLSMSIHRLHSVVANLTREVDGHAEETHALQSQFLVSHERTQQVEMALQKLYSKHMKLKQQSQEDKKKLHQLEAIVGQYEKQLERQGLQLVATQMQQHELQLQLQQQCANSSSLAVGRNRTDSTFSEVLLEDLGMDMTPPSAEAISIAVRFEAGDATLDAQQSDSRKSVFEGNGPTLCYSAHGSNESTIVRVHAESTTSTPSIMSTAESEKGISVDICGTDEASTEIEDIGKDDANNVTVDEPVTTSSYVSDAVTNISAPDQKKSVVQVDEKKNFTLPGMVSSLNNTLKSLGSHYATASYTLKMIPPFQMQFAVIDIDDHECIGAEIDVSVKGCAFKKKAFAIIGFIGFDEVNNMKPSLGTDPRAC
jgi:hypothetical protein